MSDVSFDRIDASRLSPQSRWTIEHLAVPVRLDDRDLDEVAAEHDLGGRAAKRMLAVLDAEIRAQQFGAEIPDHTKQELAALEEHLRRHGQIYPVVRIWVGGRVVEKDGATREALLTALGLPVKYQDVVAESLEDARSITLGLNVARRQLDPKKIRAMASAEVLHDPRRSDRSIGELIGVHHATVAKARRELEKLGKVDTASTRVGKDGVEQPVAHAPAAPRREEKLTEILAELRDLAKAEDRAAAHRRADVLAVETLCMFGVHAIADLFEKIVERSAP